ncbi:MAG: radical SAM protein [Ruminiclostridium sp.]
MDIKNCTVCPRECHADRTKTAGFCGGGDKPKLAKAMLHFGEEPCISGERGSGAVFFSGCSLKCCFCQNYPISNEGFGREITIDRLSEIFLELQQQGANNINLVNPTHQLMFIIPALERVKDKLKIPVVFNSGGYEKAETLKKLDGLIDIYLPDFKYMSSELSLKYSAAKNYSDCAKGAITEMYRQTGKALLDEKGIMQRGLIIRHLILPKCYRDSIEIMEWIAANLPVDDIFVSVMRQYTPCYGAVKFPEINRRLTTFEYEKVIDECVELGIRGFSQEKTSSTLEMTPDFDLSGV